MSTDRLYYLDSYLREFTAQVIEMHTADGDTEVVLDRSAFYPEGGGQPSDLGSLGDAVVKAVAERGEEVVHHVRGELPRGELVGRVDWERRFDHMQQHSGQHLLSQAFERVLDAKTVSFHMGQESSSIDLAVPSLTQQQVASVEALTNQVVFESRPILVHLVEPSELGRFDLRKGTDRVEQIRIVEIQDFDAIPCGGTHVRSTSEVGMVKVTRWERRSGNIRVEFLCGWRALRDYQEKNGAVVGLATALSVRDRELRVAVERLLKESVETRQQLGSLRNRLLDYRAEELSRRAEPVGRAVAVVALLPDADPEELKHLAARLTEGSGRIALLAATGERTHLVFARSDDLPFDAGALLRRASEPFGGRGGGRPNHAQGGIPEPGKAQTVLEGALTELRSILV